MTWLIVLASILAYGLVAAGSYVLIVPGQYARSYELVVEDSKKYHTRTTEDDLRRQARSDTRLFAGICAGVWPLTAAWVIGLAVIRFVKMIVLAPLDHAAFRPVDQREARAAQLRIDAAAWRKGAVDGTASAAERDMAAQLAEMCEQRAKELTL